MRLRPFSSLLLASVLGAACGPEPTVCSTEARASLQVTVVNSQGRAEPGVQVTYTVDGGPEERATCTPTPTPDATCRTWVAGYERPGHYVVTATSADGTRRMRWELEVGSGTCHVATENLTLVLPDPA